MLRGTLQTSWPVRRTQAINYWIYTTYKYKVWASHSLLILKEHPNKNKDWINDKAKKNCILNSRLSFYLIIPILVLHTVIFLQFQHSIKSRNRCYRLLKKNENILLKPCWHRTQSTLCIIQLKTHLFILTIHDFFSFKTTRRLKWIPCYLSVIEISYPWHVDMTSLVSLEPFPSSTKQTQGEILSLHFVLGVHS